MFTKIKMSQHSLSRPYLQRISGTALLAATSLFLLAGCGGGGGNGNTGGSATTGTTGAGTTGVGTSGTGTGTTGGSSPFAGSYQGVSLNTSGPYSPAAGTTVSTISPSGAVSVSTFNFTTDGSTSSSVGTVSSTGTLALHGLADATQTISGSVSQNPTTHVLTIPYTESNGTKGVSIGGPVPTASPLAGSYSGPYTSKGGGQGTTTLTIGTGGAVTGTTLQQGTSSAVSGYVDSGENIYLADISGGVAQIATGPLTLSGSALTGTLALSGSDGSSDTITVSLTKQ